MWKWIIGVVVFLAAAAAGAGYWAVEMGGVDRLKKKLTPEEKPLDVRLEEVRRGDLVRAVNAPGTIQPETTVEISAQVSAKIVALPFKEGDDVKAGDVVCRLDSQDTLARLDAAKSRLRAEQARLEGVRASLALAEIELGRTRELYQTRDLPKSELDATEARYLQARSSLAATEASIEAARAEITEREKDLANTVIVSPNDGTIIQLDRVVGEQVLGTLTNAGTVIMRIADLSRMTLRARVDETNIGPVRPGQRARVYLDAAMDRPYEGEVQRVKITRQVDPRDGTGYFETEILVELPREERRRIGRMGNTDIEVETLSGVVKIPSQAVVDRRVDDLPKELVEGSPLVDRNKTFARVVFTVEDGKAVARPVSVGPSDLTDAVILAGLSEGDRIITGPYKVLITLKHGQAVADPKKAKGPEADGQGASGEAATEDGETEEQSDPGDGAGPE